jgi:hypothetical protein
MYKDMEVGRWGESDGSAPHPDSENKMKREILGRTSRLLSFDATRTA